jgi:Heterokaryon incompatibility protein (HET)
MSSNLPILMESIPIEQLSKVFQDAIDLTRRIGIEYIWIDSLCIVQDSNDDWTRESDMMGKVYQHSWVNISATGFKNGSAGLFIRRSPSLLRPVKFNLSVRDTSRTEPCALSKGRYYCLEDFWDASVTAAPLMQRAWVFQERVLAPRVLHFGERQMFWECRELEASEVFPVGIPKQFKKRFKSVFSATEDIPEEHGDVAALEIWGKMVADYNRKALTRSSDKLIAISGLAKVMQNLLKDELVAGLWKRHILQQLLWSTRNLPSDATRQRPTEYQAPSWSWASLNVAIQFLPVYDANPLVAIKDIVFEHGCEVETGPATQGSISIRGRLTRPSFTGLDEKLGVRSWDGGEIELTMRSVSSEPPLVLKVLPHPDLLEYDPRWKDHWKDGFPFFPPITAFGSREFWLLPICEFRHWFFGLILKHTGVKGQYRRLGIFLAETKSEIQFAAVLSHTPFLEPVEYKERYENGESLIKIV